jgi:hypothetical protein
MRNYLLNKKKAEEGAFKCWINPKEQMVWKGGKTSWEIFSYNGLLFSWYGDEMRLAWTNGGGNRVQSVLWGTLGVSQCENRHRNCNARWTAAHQKPNIKYM